MPPSLSIATVEDTTQKVQKTPHTEDKPDEKQFTIDKPSEKHSSDDKLSEKQSTIDKPSEKHSSDDKPSEKQPSIDKPSEKQPSIRKPKKAKVVPSPKSENRYGFRKAHVGYGSLNSTVLFFCGFHFGYQHIPANHPDFIGTVPIFYFQNLQKSGHSEFLEFQPVTICFLTLFKI